MPPTAKAMAAIIFAVSTPEGAAVVCLASSFMFYRWQARRESNPQPAVLETAALPIELLACGYLRIFATTPAPTVRPPSRMAKRRPFSIAIVLISSIIILMLLHSIYILVIQD